jgi:predicted DNA-binding transcriptional regulator AlpA
MVRLTAPLAGPPRLFTAQEVAALLGVSIRQVWRMRLSGALPAPVRIGKRSVRWREADLALFVRRLN